MVFLLVFLLIWIFKLLLLQQPTVLFKTNFLLLNYFSYLPACFFNSYLIVSIAISYVM